ncbi:MAG: purine-binding chemotaxis protein CheW [Clostridiales bacterium]|jgi:purine-binding chemotaxis protein CheW|nr:chemotaxis protein CheW [Eubacteriales bacterium]MDD3198155.1 chemotaxis protein CheW [Eubacteriales bacterium]MDD4683559.1 chemotaxis protein CheW [Eubacteriales bacterium]MDN5314265.1 purine-binding chemotaxis protein CheW [Clostridiales bacterium]
MQEDRTMERLMDEDSMQGKYLTFQLGDETYGIEIRYVTEIIGMQSITEVPDMPSYLRGIINLRGKIIPVLDMRARFKKPLQEYHDRTCIIVVDIREVSVGLIVDQVSEVLNIDGNNIELPPDGRTGFSNRFINGIGKVGEDIKLLIDCDRILTKEEYGALLDS